MPPLPLLVPPSILNAYNIRIPPGSEIQMDATHTLDTIVIGLPRASVNGTSSGVAVVFDDSFEFQALLLPEKLENEMIFGKSVAVSQSSTLIVVCSPYEFRLSSVSPPGTCSGFTRSTRFTDKWIREKTFSPPVQDYQNAMQFGWSVAIDAGNNVLITAPSRSPFGAAYFFQPHTSVFQILPVNVGASGWGSACAIYKDAANQFIYIAISAPLFDDALHDGVENGIVELFTFDPILARTTSVTLRPALLPSSYTNPLVKFGKRVVLSQNRVLVLSDFGLLHTFLRGTVFDKDYLFEATFKAPSSLDFPTFESVTMNDDVIIALDSSNGVLHRFEFVTDQSSSGTSAQWQHREVIVPSLPIGESGEAQIEQVLCAFNCRRIVYTYIASSFETGASESVGALQCSKNAECDLLIDCASFDLCLADNPVSSMSSFPAISSSAPPPPSSSLFSSLDSASLAPSSPFLSTNLIVGLIAGGAALLLCIIFIFFSSFLFTRRRRRASSSSSAKSSVGSRRNTTARRLTRQGSALRHQQPRKVQSRRNTGGAGGAALKQPVAQVPTSGYSSATELQQLKRQNDDGGYFIPPRPRKIYSE